MKKYNISQTWVHNVLKILRKVRLRAASFHIKHAVFRSKYKFNPIVIFFFGLLCAVFFTTRLQQIGEIPPSVYWDEASIGYNAYSIGINGRDEWGDFLPIHFRAFGEFKLPVYIYSVVPFVKALGLTETSIRLPAVLYSFGVVVLLFFILKKITKSNYAGLFASFYLTFSPGFFIFTRVGYEATAGVFFLLFGFLLSLFYKKGYKTLILSTFSYILAIYSYNSMRVIVPMLALVQWFYFYKNGYSMRKILLLFILLGMSVIPIARLFLFDFGGSRFLAVGDAGFLKIISNYVSHFDPSYLFNGDINPRSTLPGFGVLWDFDIYLLLIGIYVTLKAKNYKYLMIAVLFLLSFVPAALTKEAPHALRSILSFPLIAALWAIGMNFVRRRVSRGYIISAIFIFLVLFSFEKYINNFSSSYRNDYSEHWQYAYKEVFTNYSDDFAKYDKIVVSDKFSQPYIFALFYMRYDPDLFRSTVEFNNANKWGESLVRKFGKFEFKNIEQSDFENGNIVFASESERQDKEESAKVYFLNGQAALYVYDEGK